MKRSKTIRGVGKSRLAILVVPEDGTVYVCAETKCDDGFLLRGADLTPAGADKAADALHEAARIVREAKKGGK